MSPAARPVKKPSKARRSPDAMTRSEEELNVDVVAREAGRVRVRKTVTNDRVERSVGRNVETADAERVAPNPGDSGEIEYLPDGSVSVPVLEEQLVVEKRVVVRERIIIRKQTVTEHEKVKAELRRERIAVEADDAVRDRVVTDTSRPRGNKRASKSSKAKR